MSLISAVLSGSLAAVKKAIAAGRDLEEKSLGGQTPLFYAASNGAISITRALLDAGANVRHRDHNGATALHMAVAGGEIGVVRALLREGIDANVANNRAQTAVHFAARLGRTMILEELIDFEYEAEGGDPIDINAVDEKGRTALWIAVEESDAEIAQILCNYEETNINQPDTNRVITPLRLAAETDETEVMEVLLATDGIEVNLTMPIIGAIENHHLDAVQLLIAAGAALNIGSVIAAVKADDRRILSALLDAGANINQESLDKTETALYVAAAARNHDMVAFLLGKGADAMYPVSTQGNKTIKALAQEGAFGALVGSLFADKKWTGFTRDDVEKLDWFLDTEPPEKGMRSPAENYSMCPVCLAFVTRSSGCKYMLHRCMDQPSVHRRLYAKFKDAKGNVSWCTVCGRVCKWLPGGHHCHFQLQSHSTAHPELVTDLPEKPDYYSSTCKAEGGGDYEEKFVRVRRFKEEALRLQAEVGKISHSAGFDRLVEAMWDAPLQLDSRPSGAAIKNMIAAKQYNTATNRFPVALRANSKGNKNGNTNTNTNMRGKAKPLLDYRRPPGTTMRPLTLEVGAGFGNGSSNTAANVVGFREEGRVVYLRHMTLDGAFKNHAPHEGIGEVTLVEYVDGMIKNFGDAEAFMVCPFGCGALLFPEEIVDFVPAATYARYRELFNRKYQERAASAVPGYTVEGVAYDPAVPYRGAVGGAGLA